MTIAQIKETLKTALNIDKNEKILEIAQTVKGKILISLFLGFIFLSVSTASFKNPILNVMVLLSAFIFAYFPKHRTFTLIASSLAILVARPFWYGLDLIIQMFIVQNISPTHTKIIAALALVTYLAFVVAVMVIARKKKDLFIVKYPIRTLVVVTLTLYFSSFFLFNLYIVAFLSCLFYVFKSYFWYLAYTLAELKLKTPPPLTQQIGHFKNFWCGLSSIIPIGKGSHYLTKKLAKNNRELAVNQLKALKLIFWCVVIIGNLSKLLVYIMSYYHIEKIDYYQLMILNGQTFPIWTGWLSLIYSVVDDALQLCFGGNVAIAIARFAGFNLPRFMYKPLSSRTLVDFWNRYHYYFKELLVDLFFFPTFLKYFKKHPRLRLIFATFMAAGVGNFLFHFLKYGNALYVYDIATYTVLFSSYIFYCVLLTIGICVSQFRINSGIKPKDDILSRLFSFICIWGFVCGVYIFGNESLRFTFMERVKFMGILIGINV